MPINIDKQYEIIQKKENLIQKRLKQMNKAYAQLEKFGFTREQVDQTDYYRLDQDTKYEVWDFFNKIDDCKDSIHNAQKVIDEANRKIEKYNAEQKRKASEPVPPSELGEVLNQLIIELETQWNEYDKKYQRENRDKLKPWQRKYDSEIEKENHRTAVNNVKSLWFRVYQITGDVTKVDVHVNHPNPVKGWGFSKC